MMEYRFEITETLSRQITIQSTSEEEAYRRIKALYQKEFLILDSSDFIDVEFTHLKEKAHKEYPCISHDKILPYFKSSDRAFTLLHGDCIELLKQFNFKFDMIFADPPYFLSNGGISVQSGKVVCVDKGEWDKGGTPEYVDSFNRAWIKECREKLKDNGTIWISGTYHNIFSIANILTELGFKILNVVTWAKTNPPPNISCRYFTYSTEFIIWARKSPKVPHCYNYEVMKQINEDKQMTDVWQLPAIARWEKSCGKHPTQKPLSVLSRIVLASTHSGAWILDPFTGSSTTGIAANLLGRRFLGIDKEEEYLILSQNRKKEIEQISNFTLFRKKIKDIALLDRKRLLSVKEENTFSYDLPF